MDPAHVPYAHYGIMRTQKPKGKNLIDFLKVIFSPSACKIHTANFKFPLTVKVDREGGRPLEMTVKKLDANGFNGKQEWGSSKFIAPCIFYAYTDPVVDQGNGSASSAQTTKVNSYVHFYLQFLCLNLAQEYLIHTHFCLGRHQQHNGEWL